MSYVLGFIIADGCIGVKRLTSRASGGKYYYFNITSKDRLHLEKIRRIIGSRQKLYSKSSKAGGKEKYYFIQVSNQEICKDLLRLGVYPKKTYNLAPIEIPDRYFNHFVRGFFDGDGSVYIYKVNGTLQIKSSFVSPSLRFLKAINQGLCRKLAIPEKNIHAELPKKDGRRNTPLYSVCFYIDDCERLFKFMYRNDDSLYLSRKRSIFQEWRLINRRNYRKTNYPSKIKQT